MARPEQQRGRTQRKKRLTQKAQEAHKDGEVIPGLAQSTSTPEASSSPLRAEDALRAMKKLAILPPRAQTLPPKYHAPSGTTIPAFGDEFPIYFWPLPKPQDCTRLNAAQKKFKETADQNDPLLFPDSDLASDWADFAGNLDCYAREGSFERKSEERAYAIASTFVCRAKRAYLAGKSWERFETEEEDIDSRAAAVTKEPDKSKWNKILGEALDNGLRLAVFDQLKQRLCEEIWSQRYRPRGPASTEARVRAEQEGETLVKKNEQTVGRWDFRIGGHGEVHPVPIFKEDTGK